MNRRSFTSGLVLVAGLYAGCTTSDRADGDNGTTESPTPTPTESATETPSDPATETSTESATETPSDSATETPSESPDDTPSKSGAVTDTSFEIVDNDCGTGEDAASVERGTDRITVRGTISGRNGCFTAELERATYDTDAGEMTVAVRSYSSSEGSSGCTECIVDIDYRATVSYDAPDPETVTVRHNDEQVD